MEKMTFIVFFKKIKLKLNIFVCFDLMTKELLAS